MEGVDPARLARVADRLLAMRLITPQVGAVARDTRPLSDERRTGSAASRPRTLWPAHHAGLDVLLEKVSLARSLGISPFGLYNLTDRDVPTLEWARAVGPAFFARRGLKGAKAPVWNDLMAGPSLG